MFVSLLLPLLSSHPTIVTLQNSVQKSEFKIAILEKKPGLYVTDGDICFQAVIKPFLHENKPNPFNSLQTNSYTYSKKIAFCFDFDVKNTYNSPYLNPYQPQFHFGTDFQIFRKRKSEKVFKENYETILVKKWRVSVVNISNTGFYAPLVQIYEHEKVSNQKIAVVNFSSILYHPEIRKEMERFRLMDIRTLASPENEPLPKKKTSFWYHKKSDKAMHVPPSHLSFTKLDEEGKYVKHKPKASSLIVLGNTSGVCRFIKPLPKNDQIEPKKELNFKNLNEVEKSENQLSEFDEINDADFGEQSEEEAVQKKEELEFVEKESESSSEEEDLLQLTYQKEMEKKKFK